MVELDYIFLGIERAFQDAVVHFKLFLGPSVRSEQTVVHAVIFRGKN